MSYSHYAANGPVLHAFVDNAGDTINWLMDHGVEFTRLLGLGGSPAVWHTFDVGQMVGEKMIDPLYEKAQEAGVTFRMNTRARQLVTKDGNVAGVIAQDNDGNVVQFNAKAIMLCTGGYADNADLFKEFVGRDLEEFFNNGVPGRNGDGILMGRSLNASLHHPGAVMFNGGRVKDTNHFYAPVNLAFYRQFNFRVNENAQRYWNEAMLGDFTAHGNSIVSQKRTISIIDQAYVDTLSNIGLYYGTDTYGYPAGKPVPEIAEELPKNPNVVISDDIIGIAEAFGLDAETLEASVERYNEFCEKGVDEDYGKNPAYLQPLSTPPYYAAELIPSFFCTVGGLKVDSQIRVVDQDGKPIVGLYACGSDAGGIYGHDYDVSAASGSQQGWAATSGRLAAEHAVANLL